ncbi:hypothetical protein LY76DRAFT_625476 [Colletotrichum caudatum]|nr:hypothetical protein LY76DRAFT_625476 [Colletotrichum caudatum]
MPSKLVVSEVVAVREDEGRKPEIIPQQFELRVQYSQNECILFCLVIRLVDSDSNKIIFYLQITADSLDSLERTNYSKTHAKAQTPSYLDDVRKQLKNIRSVTRLKFQLHSRKGIQLVVPPKFDSKKISDDIVRSAFQSVELLAASSMFSLYFQHNVFTVDNFQRCAAAVGRPATAESRKSYNDMLDVKRLYNGRGGIVHNPRGHRHGLPPTRERCSSPASATTASCGSTLAFETDPRPGESPPPYAERKSPTVRSDAAATAISAKSPGAVPPRYSHIKRHDVLGPFQCVSHCGSEDTDLRPTATKRPFTAVCTTRMTAGGASRPQKVPRSRFVDSDQSKVELLITLQHQNLELQQQLELQGQAIKQLLKDVEELRRGKNKLEGRQDDLEADYADLKEHQDGTTADIEDLSIDVAELKGKYDEVMEQIPNLCDEEFKNSMKEMFEEDMCNLSEDRMAKQIGECIEAHVDEMKRNLRQALR